MDSSKLNCLVSTEKKNKVFFMWILTKSVGFQVSENETVIEFYSVLNLQKNGYSIQILFFY